MDKNRSEDDLARLSLSFRSVKAMLFSMMQADKPVADLFPMAAGDLHQVAVIMRGFDLLPESTYPHINGIVDGKELPEDLEPVYLELKGVFSTASNVLAGRL